MRIVITIHIEPEPKTSPRPWCLYEDCDQEPDELTGLCEGHRHEEAAHADDDIPF